ncbi:MAG: putative saccharopine dehydrogenase/reductase, partial [Frankiales bacterium]|nr:putative saccharopine dehydrogenase/reductase [Frankiales bacterium]
MREHDLVLHGATGFVGVLTAEHLKAHGGSARIALSGRSRQKLENLRAQLGVDWPVVVADAADEASMTALAESTTAVATTVGPYMKYGKPLVRACAEAGTAYADLTGEVLFVRDSHEAVHKVAVDSGARIVHATGFDSVPSDLGVWMLHEQVVADGEGTVGDTVLLVRSFKGGVSGGTVDSLRTIIDEVKADTSLRSVMLDPYSLSPDRVLEPDTEKRDVMIPTKDPLLGQWVAPFVMASYNTRIVRRTNSLLGHAYGPGFRYREVMSVGTSPAAPVLAGGVTAGIGVLAGGLGLPGIRRVMDRVLPKPGEGPSEKLRNSGHFRVEVHTRTSTGARYVATVAAQGDPGYAATAVMFGESGLCLALDAVPERG